MSRLLIENILDRKETIMNEQITTLASLTIDGKGSYGIGASAVPFSKDLYTYLRITDIKDDGTLNLQDLKSVDDVKASEYLLKPNDIVFARTGASTGRNYFYDGTDGEFVYAGFLIKFSIDEKKVNPKYIKYFCQSKQYKDWINSFNTGSTRGNINAQTLGKMPIPLIERKTQDALVSIISSIDEKIKKNNAINKNLEQQAQAIFKSWFIDFEPFSNRKPSDWSVSTLGNVSIMGAGGDKPQNVSPRKTDLYEYPIYSNGLSNEGLYGFTDNPKVSEESVTVSARGTIGFVCLRHIPYVPIVRLVTLIPKTEIISAKYLYLWLKQLHIIGTGTTQQQLTVPDFQKTEILVPSKEIVTLFTATVEPIFEKIWANQNENEKLSSLRDTLLPKLMSGELDVSDIEL